MDRIEVAGGSPHPALHTAMSRIAWVKCGRILGSDSIPRQDMGPCFRYVFRNVETASLSDPPCVTRSILDTVSGLKIPCAVGKLGNVSQLTNTEFDRLQLLILLRSLIEDFEFVEEEGKVGEGGIREDPNDR